MRQISEFLSTKINNKCLDTYSDDFPMSMDLINKYKFKVREMRTGNIEMISFAVKNGEYDRGMRFSFYIDQKPYCIRKQHYDYCFGKPRWSTPGKMHDFDNIDDLIEFFEKWCDKKLELK